MHLQLTLKKKLKLLGSTWKQNEFHGDVDLEIQITSNVKKERHLPPSNSQIYDFYEFAESESIGQNSRVGFHPTKIAKK